MRYEWTQSFVAISTAAMEASWIYILLFVLTVRPQHELSRPVLHAMAVFGLLSGSLAYVALRDFLGLRGRFHRLLFVLLALLASLWAAKGGISGQAGLLDGESWWAFFQILGDLGDSRFLRALIALGAGLLLCWRGAALSDMDLEAPMRSFRVGILVSSFSILVGSIFLLDLQTVGPALIRAIISFFLFGLIGVAVTQLRRERADPRSRPDLRWFLVFLPAIVFILIVSIGIATAFSPEEMGDVILPLWNRLVDVVIWLVTPIVVAGYALIGILAWFLRPPGGEGSATATGEASPSPIIETVAPLEEIIPLQPSLPGPWRTVITVTVVVLAIGALLFLIWHFLSRARSSDDILEERESLLSWDEIVFNLQDWLAHLRQRLSRERAQSLQALLEQLRGPAAALVIRRAYIRLLLLAMDRDLERGEGQTPREYLDDLRRDLPEHAVEAATLTDAYIRARYDPRPAPAVLAQQAESAWENIRRREQYFPNPDQPEPNRSCTG